MLTPVGASGAVAVPYAVNEPLGDAFPIPESMLTDADAPNVEVSAGRLYEPDAIRIEEVPR